MNWFISKIIGLVLIVAGVVLEVMWVSFLFGSVLGIVLLLIFAPGWFFAPLGITTMGIGFLFIDKDKGEISESPSLQHEGQYTKGRSAEIFIKILKIVVILFSLFLVGVGIIFAYQYYEKNKKEKDELAFYTSLKWDWLDRDKPLKAGIQIHTPEGGGGSILRKVNLEKKSAIYVFKNDDYSITTIATFAAKCQPEKEIVTSKTFSDGEPKKLVCNKDGNQLYFSVRHSRKDDQFTWLEDLDGFSINEGFYFWDFSKLDREVTLSKLALPRLALIIDDMGYRPTIERQLLALDLELTFSFIPFTPHQEEMLNLARQHNREVLLHLPLEAENEKLNDITGLLRTTMDQAQIAAGFRASLAEVPTAVGVNNHLGSRFTADPEAMNRLLAELAKTELFFLDSRTTGASVAAAAAERHGVPFLRRDLFLDNERDEAKISAQLEKLVAIATERGWAVGIAHPYPTTLNVLKKEGPALQERVQLVRIGDLLEPFIP